MQNISDTSPIKEYIVLFICSFTAAAIFYGVLESSGTFDSKGMQLGGAIAGFLIVLIVSHRILASIHKQKSESAKDKEIVLRDKKIDELQNEVDKLLMGGLPDIVCPTGYEVVFSRDHGLGFSRPSDWFVHQEKYLGVFLKPMHVESSGLNFQGNIVVTATNIESPDFLKNLISRGVLQEGEKFSITDEVLVEPLLASAAHLKAKEISRESAYFNGIKGIRYKARYCRNEAQKQYNIMDAITIYFDRKEQIFIFSCHESEELFESTKETFDKVLSTIKLV